MRARNIKPGICKNDELAECSPHARLLFIYMWMLADREGRIENRPKRIKAECFPYEDVNIEKLLDELRPFLVLYGDARGMYIQIVNFTKHQNPHRNEKDSVIPSPEDCRPEENERENNMLHVDREITGQEQDKHHTNPADSLIPDSLIPDSLIGVKSGDVTQYFDEGVVEFVTQYQTYAADHLGNKAPKVTKQLIKNGCDTVDKLVRLDGHDLKQIKFVLRWAVQDDFWSSQVYSLASLRRAKDGLTKFQKILAACEKECRGSITGSDVLRAAARKGGCDGKRQGESVHTDEISGSGGPEITGNAESNGSGEIGITVVQDSDTEARRALANW